MSLDEIESWGGRVFPCGGPGDRRRLDGVRDGTIDAVFDEGISAWIDETLGYDMSLLDLDEEAFAHLGALGWRRVPVSTGRFAHIPGNHQAIDFSGWPLYASAALPDAVAYEVCGAFASRHDEMPWETGTHGGLAHIGRETEATPMDVPLHPGAERWYREHIL